MPRILKVKKERNLRSLTARLVRADASPAETKRAEKAIKAANPHIDFERLKPDTVVIVPDVPEIPDVPSEHVAADLLAVLEEQLFSGLEAVKKSAAEGEKRRASERSKLDKLLGSSKFRDAVGEDEGLKRDAAALAESLDREKELSKERKKELREALKKAETDFNKLKRLFP